MTSLRYLSGHFSRKKNVLTGIPAVFFYGLEQIRNNSVPGDRMRDEDGLNKYELFFPWMKDSIDIISLFFSIFNVVTPKSITWSYTVLSNG